MFSASLAMFSASRRDLDGSRDTHGDDFVGCRCGRRQRNGCESRPPKRRKLGGRATTAYRRRVRLLRLMYTVGVVGAGVVIVWASSSTEAYRAETIETRTTKIRTQARISGAGKKMAGVALKKAAAEGFHASKIGGRYVSAAVAGDGGDHSSSGVLNRLLLATSDEDQHESVEGLADEEEEEGAAAACADNAFSGGGAGTVMLLVIAILFTFNGLAIVCDEFFQASLEKISEVLGLTPDVAGATFLAAGSSAPELFTSIADVFGPSNSIGVGTIVGSAMFNVLVIVALSAAVAVKSGTSGTIDHRVVARDVSFYTCSIFMLVASASDGEIRWWEALTMVLAYGLYIVFMVFNSRILEMCSTPKGTVLPTVGGPELEALEPLEKAEAQRLKVGEEPPKPFVAGGVDDGNSTAATRRRSSARRRSADGGDQGSEEGEGDGGGRRGSQHLNRRASRALRVSLLQERRTSQGRRSSYVAANEGNEDPMAAAAAVAVAAVKKGSTGRLSWDGQAEGSGGGACSEGAVAAKSGAAAVVVGNTAALERTAGGYQIVGEETGEDLLTWPEGWMERFLFVFGLPFLVGLSLTVPDCSRPEYEKYYILTFVMSISWISIISSYMVALATGAACILGVSAIVMGVLVLAVGTSVPDMIGSMIAAKNGEASMAIANAIGSNVFNILLGLGGPWLFSSLVSGESTAVDSEGATTALIILFCAVLVFVISLILSRWNMNTKLAYSLLFTYVSYVVYTITAEALK